MHERSFRVVRSVKKVTFKELLDKSKTISIHTRNLQIFVTEIFKVWGIAFQINNSNNYNLRKNGGFKPGNPKTVYYRTETISVLKPKLWIS